MSIDKTPHIEKINGHPVLKVDGHPFIMIAGEVHNSSASSVQYMEKIWEKAEELGLNTLLLPVSWELIEPKEGVFDFSIVHGLIGQARKRRMKIGLLWFGSWKNAQCYYAPEWVKTDINRFLRAEVVKGKPFIRNEAFYGMPYSTLSYLCDENMRADAGAFGKLMAFIRETDSDEHTVITVQVENETGLMGAAREHSEEADKAFSSEVPRDFADFMHSNTGTMTHEVRLAVENGKRYGNWEAVFGTQAEEIFSAYHIAKYVNTVAEAGKREYPLPFTVNCWLNKPGEKPGSYPSGGPVSKMAEVWHFCAPNIDVITPDIYVPNFSEICDEYTRRGNPLYIPECATHSYAGTRELLCVGRYHAMCYSPFGFEDIGLPFNNSQMALFGIDVTDPALATPQNAENYGRISRILCSMMPVLTSEYGTKSLQASSAEVDKTACFSMGKYIINVSFPSPDGACLVLQESEDRFYIVVQSAYISFESADPKRPGIDILSLEEGEFIHNQWNCIRRLNGDEAVMNNHEKPTLLRAKLFAF